MKLLDYYIVRRFLGNLISALLAFVLIFIIVDLVEHVDLYIDRQTPLAAIVMLYIYFLPFIIVMSMPVGVLLASLFCTGQMAKHNELMAIKSTGTSIYRILTPMLIIGLIVSALTLFLDEFLAPPANRAKREIELTHIEHKPARLQRTKTNITYGDKDNRRILIRVYDAQKKLARNVSVQEYSGADIHKRIDGPTMTYRENRWLLQSGIERIFTESGERATEFAEPLELDFDITPDDLAQVQLEPEEMSSSELREFIEEVKRGGGNPDRWRTDLHLKFAFPFANFIIVLIGASLAANKRRSGAAVGFGISLLVCFLYFGLIKMGQSLGYTGTLPPEFAPWLGNIVFLAVGLTMLYHTRT